MAEFTTATNPLVISIDENTVIRAVFERVQLPPEEGAPPPPPADEPFPPSGPGPTPTPTVRQWRNCIDDKLETWPPPNGYREVPYSGASGGTCWEPITEVGFDPSISNLTFVYQRGTDAFPAPYYFKAQNPSTAISYRVKFSTNNTYFTITPAEFNIGPRESVNVSVSLNEPTIPDFGDGVTDFTLRLDITQI
jgi:hypothetical protein